ncbi:multisubunit sodium/proton antiporter MrpC subunit [Rhodococcus sp. OK611]|uniref:Na(+)/H(+) antiporter subunit C n=1 Tax=unclassified Rhodococcus (in: high G+C Gram-positive bacteria) TaxID=192944 RepID=UPI000BCE1BDB|nr:MULTISPECIES: Na(+)/H(+) antiporter subunit C [unclassified Rhodococcus (in: high G+C Gram-positive bacteria)]PTR45053.1 multisubunit sodium/proton antiporter MrpC subunit [Rhodococcus sp. OK611]SNX89388.1 multisubunit sodium/proton antiporter, MrpC subunit [Rhodococcus sp. OK270]
MSANFGILIVVGVLIACGVYLLLERSITKMLLGLLLFGNGVNLLILTVGGPPGSAPIVGRTNAVYDNMADPLAQAMILTAIVITMGIAAFVMALAYRSYKINTKDAVENDPEDTKVIRRRSPAEAPDHDRSDDPITGDSTFGGDAFDDKGNPIPLEQLKNLEDLECYEDLREGDFDEFNPDGDEPREENDTDEPLRVPGGDRE